MSSVQFSSLVSSCNGVTDALPLACYGSWDSSAPPPAGRIVTLHNVSGSRRTVVMALKLNHEAGSSRARARSPGMERHSSHRADRSQSTFRLPGCSSCWFALRAVRSPHRLHLGNIGKRSRILVLIPSRVHVGTVRVSSRPSTVELFCVRNIGGPLLAPSSLLALANWMALSWRTRVKRSPRCGQ